jgi:hypothetical protein
MQYNDMEYIQSLPKVITEGHEEFASKWSSLSTASQTNMACKSFA